MRSAILLALVVGLSDSSKPSARHSNELDVPEQVAVEAFLGKYLKDSDCDYKETRYIARIARLNGNARDAIVYLEDPCLCGSGGCTALVLKPSGPSSYRVVTSIGIVQLPIRILDTKAKGWHDIGVWVRGGGIQPGYEAVLSFDGRSYPTNPTVPPAKPLPYLKGGVVIAKDAEGVPLHRVERR